MSISFCMSHGNNRNQANVFCLVLTCVLHDFLEEICVAGGTVFGFCFASLKGGRVMCEGKFLACVNQRCFACLISNQFEIKRQ